MITDNPEKYPTEQDKQILADFFYKIEKKPEGISADDFIRRIDDRIYTEWCCGEASGKCIWREYRTYSGQAFEKFVDDETRYALAREHGQEAFSLNTSEGLYAETRKRVLGAVIKRAVDFFSRCKREGNKWFVQEGNRENIRTSLKDYL